MHLCHIFSSVEIDFSVDKSAVCVYLKSKSSEKQLGPALVYINQLHCDSFRITMGIIAVQPLIIIVSSKRVQIALNRFLFWKLIEIEVVLSQQKYRCVCACE